MTEERAPETGTPPATGETARFTQADVDRIITERLTRERAKFGDYEMLKQKAAEADNLQQVIAGLRGDLAGLRRRQAVFGAALAAGLPADRLEAAYRLLDAEKVAVGEDGTVQGVEEAVQGLIAAYPWLLPQTAPSPPPASGSTSNAPPPPPPPPAAPPIPTGNPGGSAGLTLEALRTMTPEQVAARIDDVQRLLRQGR